MRWGLPLLLLLPLVAATQDEPVVTARLSADAVRVGEPVELEVKILVPTWFPEPPAYPSFELPNAIVRRPDDRSYPISEPVGGETWSGIVRAYEIYPLLPARYVLSDRRVRVTWADPPGNPRVADVPVPALAVTGTVPAGAEALDPYLAGRSLELSRRVEGSTEGLAAGDALVVEYVAELDGLPALFLPPLVDAGARPGLRVYADAPKVEEGDVARRTERVTFVFEFGGGYALPAPRLRWFDTGAGEVRVAELPPLTVDVTGPTVPEESDATPGDRPGRAGLLALAGALAVVLAAVAVRLARPRLAARRRRIEASEPHAFADLRRALAQQDPRAVHAALYRWLERLPFEAGPRAFAQAWGDATLVERFDALGRERFGVDPGAGRVDGLAEGLTAARSRYLNSRHRPSGSALPALNP